jgi:hypothetical protein
MRRSAALVLLLAAALYAAPAGAEDAETKDSGLVCELRDLPMQARPGEQLKVVVKLTNTSDKPLPLLAHHVEYVTSVGTGVGATIRKAPGQTPDDESIRQLPANVVGRLKQFARMESLEGAYPEKPGDIAAILADKEIPAGASVSVPVTITLPQETGEYEVSAYVRSWSYFGVRNAIAMIDPEEVQRLYVDKVASKGKVIRVVGK